MTVQHDRNNYPVETGKKAYLLYKLSFLLPSASCLLALAVLYRLIDTKRHNDFATG